MGSRNRRDTEAWARFLARMVDGLIGLFMVTVLFFIAGMGAFALSPAQGEAFVAFVDDGLAGGIIGTIALVLSVVSYDTVLLGRFGTTPGKKLLGLRVLAEDGAPRLGALRAFKRSALLVVVGLGLEIPLVAALARVAAYFRLKEHGRTIWDERTGLRVEKHPVGQWRWAIGFLAWAVTALLSSFTLLGSLAAA